ncbi:RNA polymerase sigma factor [Rathayibacter sp. SD072]|uniref:RNA polymerase sigma factor n=1 Tax=Rathayibacter sp. SD072 TaxID=2781731 RepID=UPI001A97BF86|nr:RNA polymerase sigma factor [Rathayibacter sp. SD072]MBO0985001.1 RNA polymerase sigma factor [Rathayibacter sp. SD072]
MTRPHVESVLAAVAPDLLGYFLRRTTDPEDAADLAGETLAAAWRSSRRMPSGPEEARMWVFGVARNTLHHHTRGRGRRDALTAALGHAIIQVEAEADHDGLDVRLAVAKLPTDHAELVRLVHWDGFTLEQAATHLGIPASTARSRHARAKALLRSHLAIPAEGMNQQPGQRARREAQDRSAADL